MSNFSCFWNYPSKSNVLAFFEMTLANKIKIKLVTLSHTFGRLEKNNICDSFLPLLPESLICLKVFFLATLKKLVAASQPLFGRREEEKKNSKLEIKRSCENQKKKISWNQMEICEKQVKMCVNKNYLEVKFWQLEKIRKEDMCEIWWPNIWFWYLANLNWIFH